MDMFTTYAKKHLEVKNYLVRKRNIFGEDEE